jgi:hypothetical protein
VAWAVEAGVASGLVEDLAAVINGEEVLAERLFFHLVDCLGLHQVSTTMPCSAR